MMKNCIKNWIKQKMNLKKNKADKSVHMKEENYKEEMFWK